MEIKQTIKKYKIIAKISSYSLFGTVRWQWEFAVFVKIKKIHRSDAAVENVRATEAFKGAWSDYGVQMPHKSANSETLISLLFFFLIKGKLLDFIYYQLFFSDKVNCWILFIRRKYQIQIYKTHIQSFLHEIYVTFLLIFPYINRFDRHKE